MIGKAVFNYDFEALTTDSPLIQAVYTALKETETRATDVFPYWKVPLFRLLVPRQQKAAAAVALIRATTEELVARCRAMVEAETREGEFDPEYINDADPSVLRFLIASREEVGAGCFGVELRLRVWFYLPSDLIASKTNRLSTAHPPRPPNRQVSATALRDDLLSMLVAGHETTGSVLTWTLYLLATHPTQMAAAQAEVDAVLEGRRAVTLADYGNLKYVMRCVNESMRLYPHPPVLLRRARVADELPGGYAVPKGQVCLGLQLGLDGEGGAARPALARFSLI